MGSSGEAVDIEDTKARPSSSDFLRIVLSLLLCFHSALTSSLNRSPRVCISQRLVHLFRMSLSKHQPNLPQLCSLAVISQMGLTDRMNACQVCPEWHYRVREVNRFVKLLIITVGDNDVKDFEFEINRSVKVLRSARLLTNSDGSPQFPMHRLTKGNHFPLGDNDRQNLITLKQITSTFPSISELIFVSSFGQKLALLTEMLQNDHWRGQLISLKVIFNGYPYYNNPIILQPLFTAINSLSALKYLTLKEIKLYDLPILAQLKKISCDYEDSLLISIKEYAAKNTGKLSVEVFEVLDDCENETLPAKFSKLSKQLRDSITFLRFSTLDANLLSRCTSFPNLTLLSLSFFPSEHGHLFPALSQLHQLLQLNLRTFFFTMDPELPTLRAHLPSVKALDLYLSLDSHLQVNWLNLPETMPNLQAMHLNIANCRSCEAKCLQDKLPANISERNCLRDVLQDLHHSTGLPLNRLSCHYKFKYYRSAENLLAE